MGLIEETFKYFVCGLAGYIVLIMALSWACGGSEPITHSDYVSTNASEEIKTIPEQINEEKEVPVAYPTTPTSNQDSNPITRSTLWVTPDTYLVGGDGHTIQITENRNAKYPTYQQMVDFLRKDKTDRKPYIDGQYVCADFAEDVQYNAECAGYKCAYVTITFIDGAGHACNAFNTTDRGLIFVDCTNNEGGPSMQDCTVNIKQGSEYIPKYIAAHDWHCESMGTVRSFGVFGDY